MTLATNPTPDTSVIPAVPPCTAGTTYPAFSPTETTNNEFSWCQVFVQLNAQMTGSLENELQMLDSSNNVISGSNVDLTGIGQGSAVSAIGSPVVQAIASGLNQPKQVAADPSGIPM